MSSLHATVLLMHLWGSAKQTMTVVLPPSQHPPPPHPSPPSLPLSSFLWAWQLILIMTKSSGREHDDDGTLFVLDYLIGLCSITSPLVHCSLAAQSPLIPSCLNKVPGDWLSGPLTPPVPHPHPATVILPLRELSSKPQTLCSVHRHCKTDCRIEYTVVYFASRKNKIPGVRGHFYRQAGAIAFICLCRSSSSGLGGLGGLGGGRGVLAPVLPSSQT